MDFSQFCVCGPAGYARLKGHIDACARQGRSYEFLDCTLPAGCSPARTRVGFWREGDAYLLYFRPAVSYQGPDPRLADFWSRGEYQLFSGFDALCAALQALDGEALRPGPTVSEGFARLNRALQAEVLGQYDAVEAAAFKLYGHICKREPLRPLSLIFYGPTCVGKSQLAKQIPPALDAWVGQPRYQLVWTELNTFSEAHSVYRLTGAPPGYVGYEDPPVLEAVRRNPYTVFLFDELDKAHPEVLKIFMSILDEGRCTARQEDEQGSRELDFRRCIFLFTTNTDLSASPARRLGFSPPEEPKPQAAPPAPSGPAGLAQRLFQRDESARQALTRSGVLKEIAGRFSGLIGFTPLSEEARYGVTARQIMALGREFGLNIRQVDPALARALTPEDALSLRSTVGVLEGVFTPFFLAQAPLAESGAPLLLEGTPEDLRLLPVQSEGVLLPAF